MIKFIPATFYSEAKAEFNGIDVSFEDLCIHAEAMRQALLKRNVEATIRVKQIDEVA